MGRRPELLQQTLTSLFLFCEFKHIIAINDFRDAETNEAFKELCPTGQLISLDHKLGHHAAVDHMYQHVKTDWIFHSEDDWLFNRTIELDRMTDVITRNPWMSGICLRSETDFELCVSDMNEIVYQKYDGVDFYRMDAMHDQWHGFTFNPHVAPVSTWRTFGPFSKFTKERHISRAMRKAGLVMPYLVDGGCIHNGWEDSVSHEGKPVPFWSRWFG